LLNRKDAFKYFILLVSIIFSFLSYISFQSKSLDEAIFIGAITDRQSLIDSYTELNRSFFNNPKNLNSQARILLDGISSESKNKDQAIVQAQALIDESIAKNKFNGYSYFLAAELNYIKGDKKLAKSYVEESIKKDPYNNPRSYLLLSKILEEEGNKRQAIDNLDIILSQYDEQTINNKLGFNSTLKIEISNIYLYKGLLQISLGNINEAKSSLNKSLDLNKNNLTESILKNL